MTKQKQRLIPAVAELTSLCGAVADRFDKGADLLAKTAAVRLSEATVQRTTEAVGERLAEELQTGQRFGATSAWPWYREALGNTIGYIALDATGFATKGRTAKKPSVAWLTSG